MNTRKITYGEIMDYASQTQDDKIKDFCRKAFQGFCNATGRNIWDPRAVMDWRTSTIEIGIDEKALASILPMLGVASNV